jgi:hypothetical protein
MFPRAACYPAMRAADANHGAAKTGFLAASVGSVTSFWRRRYGDVSGFSAETVGFSARR